MEIVQVSKINLFADEASETINEYSIQNNYRNIFCYKNEYSTFPPVISKKNYGEKQKGNLNYDHMNHFDNTFTKTSTYCTLKTTYYMYDFYLGEKNADAKIIEASIKIKQNLKDSSFKKPFRYI